MKRGLFYIILLLLSIELSGQEIGVIASSVSSGSSYGHELVNTPDFSAVGNWVTVDAGVTITGGACVINSANSYTTLIYETISIVTGTTYKIEFDVASYSSGSIRVLFGDINTSTDHNDISYAASQHVNFTLPFTNGSTPLRITFYSWSSGCVLHIDNVSVKAVL
jgi:hypothetical protein